MEQSIGGQEEEFMLYHNYNRRRFRRKPWGTVLAAALLICLGMGIGLALGGKGSPNQPQAIEVTQGAEGQGGEATQGAGEVQGGQSLREEEGTQAFQAVQAMGAARASEPLSVADAISGVWDAVAPVLTQSAEYSRRGGERIIEGSGSAVLIDQQGLLLTNAHVIEGAEQVLVEDPAGNRVEVTNYAADEDYDLAVLDAGEAFNGVAPVPVGDSQALRVGDLALVVGYPSSGQDVLGKTLTVGYISALDRDNMVAENMPAGYGLIQTDAAINAGNSGGALLNSRGQLVGVPTLKLQSSYGMDFEGLAFAVPVTQTWPVIQGLMEQVLAAR